MNKTRLGWGLGGLLMWAAAEWSTAWAAGTPQLVTQYGGVWCADVPAPAYSNYYDAGVGVVSFSASVISNYWVDGDGVTNFTGFATTNGSLRLVRAAFGQPIESQVSQYSLGDVIPPPEGATTNLPPVGFTPSRVGNNTNAFWINANGSAIWLPSRCELVAAAGGSLEVQWNGVTGPVVYTIASIPSTRPARIYWTEPPYNAPEVYLKANNNPIYATLHYNNYVGRPVTTVDTNYDATGTNATIVTNFTSGVWLDGEDTAQCLRATEVEGILLLEYYADGTYQQSLGVQPVQVMAPTIEVIRANIGERLLPNDRYYGTDDLYPTVKAGIGGGKEDKLYLVDENSGYATKKNWLYAIRSTADTEWDAEVYWYQQDARGVEWPFEVDWYDIDWPLNAIRVACDITTNATPTFLPGGMSVEVLTQATVDEPKKESNHTSLSSDAGRLSFVSPGFALMRYSTSDDFWFDVLQGVLHNDETEYDAFVMPWRIGKELLPFSDENHVLVFDGVEDYAEGTVTSLTATGQPFTVEAWTFRKELPIGEAPVVSHYLNAEDTSSSAWELGFDAEGNAVFILPTCTVRYTFLAAGLNAWHHLAGVYDGANAFLYVDGVLRATSGHNVGASLVAAPNRPVQIGRSLRSGDYFLGRIDEVRLWSMACTADQIASNMIRSISVAVTNLLECYPMDEGRGTHLRDIVDASYATLYGNPKWTASFHLADDSDLTKMAAFPGYVYSGTAYNADRYAYPTEWAESYSSWLFGVNTNAFEIWWGRPSSNNTNMPYAIYYPSLVLHYRTFWRTNEAPDIVLASGLGSGTNALHSPTLYYQNDPALPGYNPNEEHALIIGNKAYALRDDLNAHAGVSEPFVLVNTVDASGHPGMSVFHVVRTNAQYAFRYSTQAGAAINPPMPLVNYAGCSNTTCVWGPGWEDRKESWWAKAAGNDGGTTNAAMRFYYAMQNGFCFPQRATQPAVGAELPWLPTTYVDSGAGGTPANLLYDITWPVNIPKMQVAQTLTTASGGLPAVWDQASVDVIYEQSVTNGAGNCVVLYDPVVEKSADLVPSVLDEMVSLKLATKETTSARYRFGNISPALEERLFYDPTRGSKGQIVLAGELHAPLTGTPYLLPNWLTQEEQAALLALGESMSADSASHWCAAVNVLPVNQPTKIRPGDAYVNAALSASAPSNAQAVGYVTLTFNNSTNTSRVASGLPVSLQIIQVVSNLFSSQYLDVINPDNALEEKLSLRYPDDFGGHSSEYEFEWRWSDPAAGNEPSTPKEGWSAYFSGSGQSSSNGAMGITIEGGTSMGTVFMLSDHYFAVRYRRADGTGPTGTNWSQWVSSLAPGWIQRVMTAINPYEQRFHDMTQYAPSLALSLIEQCGAPYEGPVALNATAEDSEGLIQIYQTVLDRALSLTLDAGLNDANSNDSLLFAATRLCNLYMILGNEAYADAQDPTISLDPNTGDWYDDYTSYDSSLFCFQNQMPNLLEEELALLRGRDDSRAPSVTITPVFNRLIWNYTHGIDGGEVAYAGSYNIVGDPTNTTGVISATDAKRMYPQGHGDAWGHYLSALAPYYSLLAYTNFGWNTIPGATTVGNATVGVDYFDEEEFAIAAASKARTGADVVSLTVRRDYEFGATGLDRYPADYDANRAWDTPGWASRSGQGAYFDWAVANSLLFDTVTNLMQVGGDDEPATGLNVIDRSTVDEIGDIATALDTIQTELDRFDIGLNPLGLAEDTIPFDISATELDAGKTHFEQVYDRALSMLQGAKTTYSIAQGSTDALRAQYDSAASSIAAAEEEDVAYRDQLIELYGYPYADDIGVSGTYEQGYDGPDLVNYMVLDLDETLGVPPVKDLAVTSKVYTIQVESSKSADYGIKTNGVSTNSTVTLTNTFNSLGLRVKPATWTGRRRAQGEIQAALYDFAEAYYDYLKAVQEFDNTMATLQMKYEVFLANAEVNTHEADISASVAEKKQYINNVKAGVGFFAEMAALYSELQRGVMESASEGLPKVIATVFGGISTDAAKSVMKTGGWIAWGATAIGSAILKYASETDALVNENKITQWEMQAATNAVLTEIRTSALELLDSMADQYTAIDEINIKLTAMDAAMEDVLTLIAKGERLVAERARARNRIAQSTQQNLYADMLYRTFRNEALAKYSSMFNLAARYAYLAAMAYDYETGLLDASSSSAASDFLSAIVRARTLGAVTDGKPQVATDSSEGDGGLADILARLGADWQSVKSRYGIQNPDSATTRFSLRKELFRISSASASDNTWRNTLATYWVDDLNQLDTYTKYCVPYSSTTNAEPGLVIPFSSEIIAGNNFFGRPAGGGDNFYDPTWLSTRIRAVGVWFSGYNTTFNTNAASGSGLVNTPGIYLIPAGSDTMINGADRSRLAQRHWTVYDQVLPLPCNIASTDITSSDWFPLFNSLSGSFADRRRHSSFRAHHDSGTFSDDELCSNARLVGRSVWNSQWVLIIPGRALLSDPVEGLNRFIYGGKKADGSRDGFGITDVRLYFKTYSYSGD